MANHLQSLLFVGRRGKQQKQTAAAHIPPVMPSVIEEELPEDREKVEVYYFLAILLP